MTIRAPYNFVPADDYVFFPEWSNIISQDIPFEDNVSGCMKVSIEAKTPIFIRNGYTEEDRKNKNTNYKSFSHNPDGKFFIPATSIKGELRTALSILSFGKIIHNKYYSDNLVEKHLGPNHNSDNYDLADCIFGCVYKDKSLKGRVSISHAICIEGEQYENELNPYCAEPKPSYYPIYFKQDGEHGYIKNNYKKITDSDSRFKGWKRYPVRKEYKEAFEEPSERQENNTSPFIPLKSGAKFEFCIVFHNLKKVELGALIQAIEINGHWHSLGFAKPFGYGAVQMSIKYDESCLTKDNGETYRDAFIDLMKRNVSNYEDCSQLREFYLMTLPQEYPNNYCLEYMELDEFETCKRNEEYLQYTSELLNNTEETEELIETEERIDNEETDSVAQTQNTNPDLREAVITQYIKLNGKIHTFKARIINDIDNQEKPVNTTSDSEKIKLKVNDIIIVRKITNSKGKITNLTLIKKKN